MYVLCGLPSISCDFVGVLCKPVELADSKSPDYVPEVV